MAMSAWGMLAAPLMATQLQLPPENHEAAMAANAALDAVAITGEVALEGMAALDENTMSNSSGGASTAIDIGNLGVNVSDQTGGVSDIDINNTTNGQIAGNVVSDNGGITTVFNNTGNGVIFQSTVNVNIFTGAGELPTN